MRFGHNFWVWGPIDPRLTRLNCILQDLFRDQSTHYDIPNCSKDLSRWMQNSHCLLGNVSILFLFFLNVWQKNSNPNWKIWERKLYFSWQDWFPNIFGAFWLAWPGCNAILQPPALIRRPWPLTSPLTPHGTPGTLALASLPLSGTSDVEVEQNAAG